MSHSTPTIVRPWFLRGEGIAREVITADIQRYLGPGALVKPGTQGGVNGYWITAYRTLTPAMVEDLKADSQRWQAEVQQSTRGARASDLNYETALTAYQSSQIHASRQHYGSSDPGAHQTQQPSQTYQDHSQQPLSRQQAPQRPPASAYQASSPYTHVQSAQTGYVQPGGPYVNPATYDQTATPRAVPQYSYQPPAREGDYYQVAEPGGYSYSTAPNTAGQPQQQPYAHPGNTQQQYYDQSTGGYSVPGHGRTHGSQHSGR